MKRYLSLIVLVALMLSFFGLGYAQVTTYPFVEDFETGQTHNTQVQGWTQILADGKTKYWTANSTFTNYNRTPRNGSFNAFLEYNSNAWMMRSFSFEGGVSYDVEIWARQDATSGATLAMYYGDTNTIAAMTNTIVAQVNLTNGDYQRYHGRITPATSGTYWIAIHGTATYAPWYISIDDFKVQHAPTTPVFSISPTGYDFGSLIINTTDSKTFTITNTGGGTLNITGISPTTDGYFSLVNVPTFPVALAGNATTTFNIQYAPTVVGNHTGSFTVSYTGGSATVDVSGTCYDPTIYDFPWVEGFTNTTFPPADWARYTGLFPSDPLTTTTSGWTKTNFANVSNPANPSARLNIWSTTTKYWLVTPPIAIPATGYELNFDLALTKYNNSDPVDPTQQQDDRFIVLISDSANMASAAILREWNNTGSTNVYNSIATLGEAITIDLSSHSGTKYIAFYGESTVSGGDNYLFVDNVRVRETPTAPIFSYAPDAIEFYTTYVNTATAYQNVTVTNTGIGTLTLNPGDVSIVGTDAAMFQVDPNLQSLALTADQSGNIPVRYNPTATGTHTATLRMSYGGTNYDVALTGRAVGANALLESFEDTTFPPPAWNAGN
ncbi:MAG: choice-of-anchor D domain-containing protein, partial [Candidatus Cloacimonadaceae bacterium]